MSNTINGPTGNPYLTVSDGGPVVKIQIHSYDKIGPFYLSVDKRALGELSDILKTYSIQKHQD